MARLLDTNVLSELRRKQCSPQVKAWVAAQDATSMMVSVMSLAEIRRGVELKRTNDPEQAEVIEKWLALLARQYTGRILPVTERIADHWGRLCPRQPLPGVDGFIAATALEHDLTVVTRNVGDFERSGARVLNPWNHVGEAHD